MPVALPVALALETHNLCCPKLLAHGLRCRLYAITDRGFHVSALADLPLIAP